MDINCFLHPNIQGFRTTGDLQADLWEFLTLYQHQHTYHHMERVAVIARELADRFGADVQACEQAAWLHDISAVIPNEDRLEAAKALGICVLPEEEVFPMILHQKLSVPIARDVFGIDDSSVLDAIECHTTLKVHASMIDKIVFLADKIAWDQAGLPPYLDSILEALEVSLNAAALVYLDHLWAKREELVVLHPWAVAAREELIHLCTE